MIRNTLLTLVAAATSLPARGTLEPFSTGAVGFYIGHSFFVPTSNEFDSLVDVSSFPSHSHETFFRGGMNGSPQALWNNHRCEIESSTLATGTVELLGMTVHEGTTVDDFAQWIDLALSYNADTKFFIGFPWAPDGALTDDTTYAATTDEYNQNIRASMSELRARYPYTAIYVLHYGATAVKMRELLSAGSLVGVNNLLGDASDSLYRDASPGHEGEMMRAVNALLWYSFLYGVDPSPSLIPSYDESNVNEIISSALAVNNGMNDQVVLSRPANYQPNSIDTGCDGADAASGGNGIFSMLRSFLVFIIQLLVGG